MKRITFSGLLIMLIVFTVACGKNNINAEQTGKTLVTFDGGKITTGDIDNFKNVFLYCYPGLFYHLQG